MFDRKPEVHDKEFYVKKGKHGGETTRKVHGRDHFRRISLLGVQAKKLKRLAGRCDITVDRRCPKNNLKYLAGAKCPCWL